MWRTDLDANGLVDYGNLLQFAVTDCDGVLAQEGDIRHVVGPDDILDMGRRHRMKGPTWFMNQESYG